MDVRLNRQPSEARQRCRLQSAEPLACRASRTCDDDVEKSQQTEGEQPFFTAGVVRGYAGC